MERQIISYPQLHDALLGWEREYREGRTRTNEEKDALPLTQVADESAQFLWNELIRRQRVLTDADAAADLAGEPRPEQA